MSGIANTLLDVMENTGDKKRSEKKNGGYFSVALYNYGGKYNINIII